MKTLRPSGQLGTKILYNHIVPNPFSLLLILRYCAENKKENHNEEKKIGSTIGADVFGYG